MFVCVKLNSLFDSEINVIVKLLVIVITIFKRYPSTYCLMQGSLFHLWQLLKFECFTSKLESQPLKPHYHYTKDLLSVLLLIVALFL